MSPTTEFSLYWIRANTEKRVAKRIRHAQHDKQTKDEKIERMKFTVDKIGRIQFGSQL